MEVNASPKGITMKEATLKKIYWINGNWIKSDDIEFLINDRGITFGDGIFETILVLNNQPQLLEAHLTRWNKSARALSMASPPKQESLTPLINQAISYISLSNGNGALRINWSRGKNMNRGINLSPQQDSGNDHIFWLELNQYNPSFEPISTSISRYERRNANSRLSQYKTFNYLQSIQARHESNLAGYNDAILLSTTGEVCCGATSNIIINRKKEWLTPRIESGCLPGIMRQRGLENGLFKEAKISLKPETGDHWLLINSLSCQSITKLNNIILNEYKETEILWKSLLVQAD